MLVYFWCCFIFFTILVHLRYEKINIFMWRKKRKREEIIIDKTILIKMEVNRKSELDVYQK